jgi:hypothetical protein
MPNLIVNYLYVFGKDKNAIEQFKMSVRNLETEEVISLKKMTPPPEDASAYNEEWRWKNWSTDRDIGNSILRYNGMNVVFYEFESAWNSSAGVIHNVALQYPKLYFFITYCDISNDTGGGVIFKGHRWAGWSFDHPDMFSILDTYLNSEICNSEVDFGNFSNNISKLIEDSDIDKFHHISFLD